MVSPDDKAPYATTPTIGTDYAFTSPRYTKPVFIKRVNKHRPREGAVVSHKRPLTEREKVEAVRREIATGKHTPKARKRAAFR